MTEVVGSAAIELRLDQSRLNRDLRDLESLELKPIALGVKLDLAPLQRQLKGIAIAPIVVGLTADTSGLAKQLQGFSATVVVKTRLDTTEVDRQLKSYAGERTLKLTAQVDDRQLTALNKHLDLKQKHFAQVNRSFQSSPLTPRVDLSQLEALDSRLRSLQKRYDIDVNLRVDRGALRSQIGTLDVPVTLRYANASPLGALTQKVEIDSKGLEDSLGNSVERAFKRVKGGGLLSGLGSVLTAPLRLAGSALSNTLGGLALGATQEVSRNLGKGLSTALEGALSKSVGSSELLGEKVGGAIGSAVVQEFQAQTQNLAQVLEKQIDKIEDRAQRKKLKAELKAAVELPGQIGQAAQATIGQGNIAREQLFQRGQQRQAEQARTPVIREQAVQEFGDAIAVNRRIGPKSDLAVELQQKLAAAERSAATSQKALGKIDALIKNKFGRSSEQFNLDVAPLLVQRKREQAELALVNTEIKRLTDSLAADQQGIPKLQELVKIAQQKGNQKQVGQLNEEIGNAQLRIGVSQESLQALDVRKQTASENVAKTDQKITQQFGQPAEDVTRYAGALQKAQQGTITARDRSQEIKEEQQAGQIAQQKELAKGQQLKAVSPQQQPKAYQDLAKEVLQDRFDPAKLPKLVVDETYLKSQNAGSLYNPALNAVITTQALFDAAQKASLTPEQAVVLGEEIGHADDYDFGSVEGVEAAKQKRPIGRRVTATAEEVQRFAPELGRYAPEVRESELNAKVKGARGATTYLEKQEKFQTVSKVSELAVQKDQVSASDSRKNLFKALGVLKQVAQERFVTVDKDIVEAVDRYQEAFNAIAKISEQATQTAGTATREEVTALQQEMQTALDSISGIFDSIGSEIKRLKQINPLEANQVEIEQLSAVIEQNRDVPGINVAQGDLAKASAKNEEVIENIRQQLEESNVEPEQLEAEAQKLAEANHEIISKIQGTIASTRKYLEELVGAIEPSPVEGAVTSAQGDVEAVTVSAAPVPQPAKTEQLPPAKPTQAVEPREGREGIFQDLNEQYSVAGLREVAKRVGVTSQRAKGLKKEELARLLSSTDFGVPIDKILSEVGDGAKLKAFQTGGQSSIPPLPAEALTSIKDSSAKLKELYKQFHTAQGQQRVALAQTIATESAQQTAAIDRALTDFQVEGKTAQQLAGFRTQANQRSNVTVPEAIASQRTQIQATERQAGASRQFQTVAARVVDRSDGSDLESANLITALHEGSQTVNRELGAAIERFNQAQHTLATTISTQVARFAEIEPEATLPATLQKAAGTPKGKDLLVNTAGFAASVAGQHFGGAVGGAAGDLIGALTARHALSGGQHGQGDELFGDLAGFAIGNGAAALGNLVPGVAGIPLKGAAAAIATVPHLTRLRQRIQGRLGEDDEARSDGSELESANLIPGAKNIQRTLTSKSRQLLSQLEKQLGDTIDNLALALSSDKDYAGTAGKQEIRSLNQLNQTVERLLNERGQIINETFDAEMTRANQELLQIGARIAAKTEARPDFGLLADRAIDDGTQAKSQQVIGENQQELRENKRRAFEQERQGGAAVDANQVRIDDPAGGSALDGIIQQLRGAITSVNEDLRSSFLKSAELLALESKSLLNDIKTAEIAARGRGDTDQVKKLGQAGRTTERAIAGSEKILSKPSSAVSGKEIGELQRFNTELRGVFRLLDRPAPPDPGGLNSLVGLVNKGKTAIAGFVVGFVGLQLVQSIGFQVLGGLQQVFQGLTAEALTASIKLDNLKTALDFSVGGSSQGTQSLEFVRKTVSDLGTPLESSIQGFSQLSAATRGTAAAGKTTKDVFLGIEQASTVLGLSADQTGGSLLALTQIASKGTVQSEELRGQLGERIPGAFSIAARAMGVTESALNKMLETGSVLADDFLPRFGKQLQTEFGEAAKTAGDNAQSAIFRFQNSYLTLQQTIGKELQPGAVVGLKTLEVVFKGLAAAAPEIILALSSIAVTIAVQTAPALFKLISNLILTKAATGTAIGGLQSFFQTLNTSKTAIAAVGLFALVEYFKLLSETINTEVVKSFDDLADSAARAAKNSKEVKLPGSPDKPDQEKKDAKEDAEKAAPLAGPLDVLARGEIDFSDPLRPKLQGTKTNFRNFGDVERDRVGADIGESVGQTSDFLSKANLRLTTLKTKTGAGADLQQVDQQLFDAQSQRKILQAEAERDFTRKGKTIPAELQTKIQAANTNIQGLVEKRGDTAKPFTDDLSAANQLIDNYKGKLKELDDPAKEGHFGNQAQTEERRKQLQQALKDVTAFKNQAEEQLGSFRVDPVLGLTDGFKKLAAAIEESERATKLFVSQQKDGILKNQLKTFGTDEDAGRKTALASANTERAGIQQNLDTTDTALKTGEALVDRPEAAQALAGFGVSKASSISDIKKELEATPEDGSGKAKRKILQDLLNFKELQQKKADLQVNLDEADLKVTEQVQTNALAVIDRDAGKRDQALKQDDDARAIPLRKASVGLVQAKANLGRDRATNKFFSDADVNVQDADIGIKEADLGVKSAQNQVVSVDQKTANTQRTLDELNAKKDSLSAEEFNKRQRDLTTQLADLRVEKTNAAATVEEALAKQVEASSRKIEATNRKIIEGFELANAKASAAIQLSETNQTTGTKRKLLASGLTDRNEKVEGIEQTGIDAEATQKRNALIQKEIQGYKKLAADKRISGKELNDKLIGFNQELAANNDKLVDLQIQKQKQLRDLFNLDVDHKVAADNRATGVLVRNLERQKNAAEQVAKSIEISRKLTESKGALQQAIAADRQAAAQTGVDRASKLVDVAGKAETEQDPTKKEGYEKIARSLGFNTSGDADTDKERLLDAKQAAEKNLADIKLNALNAEYALKEQLLELDLKRDKLQAEQAVREAQIAELAAQKEVRKAAGELKKAVKEGDPDKIAEAQDNFEGAQQGLELSRQSTAGAKEGLAATGQLEADSRAKLGVERSTAFAQAGQEQQNQSISQATERVEAGLDPDKVLNGGVQTNYGVQSGNYAASPLQAGGRNNDDRGLRYPANGFSSQRSLEQAAGVAKPEEDSRDLTSGLGEAGGTGKLTQFLAVSFVRFDTYLNAIATGIVKMSGLTLDKEAGEANPLLKSLSDQATKGSLVLPSKNGEALNTSGGVQTGDYAGVGVLRAGGRNNDDRGLRDTSSIFLPRQVTPAPDASSGVVEASGATGDRLGTFFDSLSSALTQRLDVLIDLTRQDLGNPKSVTLHATDPVETYAQYQNRQSGNSLRSQPAY